MSNTNRTKGNIKPSNSERAARLLPEKQFVSFSEASQTLSSIYTENKQNNDALTLEYGIDSEFQIVFKHMSKKDINTKLKALQSFVELCQSKKVDELLKISSFWFRVYRKLANTIDWRVRQDVHEAHYRFISLFQPITMIECIESGVISSSIDSFESTFSADVSFQNLITMPAVLWNSCFDVYFHSAKAAQKAFDYLYSSGDSRLEFILKNYESILNYCIFCLFDKVPINLFYTTPLPADSLKMFEEHLLVTSLLGLSSLINELFCGYKKSNEKLQCSIKICLKRIFTRLNNEFIRCKNKTSKFVDSNKLETETNTEIVLLKKERKKQKKDSNLKNTEQPSNLFKESCKFWNYFNSDNHSLQTAFFQALNSITKLSTVLLNEENHFEIVWFQLYKSKFYEYIFNNINHSVPEIRALTWLLASHLLSNRTIYDPWSVVKKPHWIESILYPFVSNGLKPVGNVVDFGLSKIDLNKYRWIFYEYFTGKRFLQVKYQLINENYISEEIVQNVNLLITFVENFIDNNNDNLQIYGTFLSGLEDALKITVLQKDVDFLVELYFDLIGHFMQMLHQNQFDVQSLVDEIFQVRLYRLLTTSFGHNLLSQSHIYLNLLLLVHYNEQLNANTKSESMYNIFKCNLSKVYSALLIYIQTSLKLNETKEVLFSVLRFFNDSIHFVSNGYFSAGYYCSKYKFDYQRNILKMFRSIQTDVKGSNRSVKFGDVESKPEIESDSKDWWISQLTVFNYNLINLDYYPEERFLFSLIDVLPIIFEQIEDILLLLIRIVNVQFDQFQNEKNYDTIFLTIHHLQFAFQAIPTQNLLKLSSLSCDKMNMEFLKWLDVCYQCCLKFNHLSLHAIAVGSKIVDLILTVLSKFEEKDSLKSFEFIHQHLNSFQFCILVNHLDHIKATPNTISKFIEDYEMFNWDKYQKFLFNQLDLLFQDSIHMDLHYDILKCTLRFTKNKLSNSGQLLKIFEQFLQHSLDHLKKQNDVQKMISYKYFVDFPRMCMELSQILFENIDFVSDDFDLTFKQFTSMYFEQMFQLSSQPFIDSNANAFIENSMLFCQFSLERLLHYERFEPKTLFNQLLDYIFENIIKSSCWNYQNYNLLNLHLVNLSKHIISCIVETTDNQEHTVKVFHTKIDQIQLDLELIINESEFLSENIFGELWELEQSNMLFALKDLFDSNSKLNLLDSLNETKAFSCYSKNKLTNLEECLYRNLTTSKLCSVLIENIYLVPKLSKYFPEDPTIQVFNEVSSFSSSKFFLTLRSLIINLYAFNSFISFYYFKSIEQEQSSKLRKICQEFEMEIVSIIQNVNGKLKKFSKSSLLSFVTFVILNDNSDVQHSFGNFCMETFFKDHVSWIDVLDHLGFEIQSNPKSFNSLSWLFISHTSHIEKLTLIVERAINAVKIREAGDNESMISSKIDWSLIDPVQINQTLFIVNFVLKRLKTLQYLEDDIEVNQLKCRLLRFVSELSDSDLTPLFEPNIPSFTNPKYVTFLLISELFNDLIEDFSDSLLDSYFSMILSVMKMSIQLIYTSLPDGLGQENCHKLTEFVLATRFLRTLNIIGQYAKKYFYSDNKDSVREEMLRNFFAFDSFNLIIPLFVVMTSEKKTDHASLFDQKFFTQISKCLYWIDSECLTDIAEFEPNQYLLMNPCNDFFEKSIQTELKKYFHNEDSGDLTSNELSRYNHMTYLNKYYDYILKYGMSLLLHEDAHLSLSSYHLLSMMIATAKWNCNQTSTSQEDGNSVGDLSITLDMLHIKDDIQTGPPTYLCELLENLDNVVHYTLFDYEFGESVLIERTTDVYKYTFVYLLGWLLYIDLTKRFSVQNETSLETRNSLINYIVEKNMHNRLFDNLFHLMLNDEDIASDGVPPSFDKYNICQYPEKLQNLIGEESATSLSKLACCVYFQFLSYLPDVLRAWFNNLKHHPKQMVDYFTTEHFSKILIEKEFECFKTIDHKLFGNINVKANKKSNEITAVYSLKEISFGMRFSFNVKYPLSAVLIECINRSGVSEDLCRKWIQRLTIFFNKMNCSVTEGIIMLRPNMDNFFEGIDECMICLFVLYGATSQLPRFKCPQCKKKFHWACIRKWFHTNHTSNCPQCKFEFN